MKANTILNKFDKRHGLLTSFMNFCLFVFPTFLDGESNSGVECQAFGGKAILNPANQIHVRAEIALCWLIFIASLRSLIKSDRWIRSNRDATFDATLTKVRAEQSNSCRGIFMNFHRRVPCAGKTRVITEWPIQFRIKFTSYWQIGNQLWISCENRLKLYDRVMTIINNIL